MNRGVSRKFFCALLPLLSGAVCAAAPSRSFAQLTDGAVIEGFRATAVYDDDSGRPFGARFRHEKSGFTLDLIQVQSAPQAFVWVTTYPISDQGEPHTQEHLLVGKGNAGRNFAAGADMSLTEFTAFTDQWRTCYPFNTLAGLPVFYSEFEQLLNALLHPDYTDEEIRREVRNFGISEAGDQHQLTLQEKGSVYNEMTSTVKMPDWVAWRQMMQDVYGAKHPLSYNSGGEPSGIRTMQASDIRRFHDSHYFLANMGAIVSLPAGQPMAETLSRIGAVLARVEPVKPQLPVVTEATIPAPQPAPAGSIQIDDFPFANDQQPGVLGLIWPADRELSSRDRMLAELFFANFSSDETSSLYGLFINSKTRVMDIGAERVDNLVSPDQGHPVGVFFFRVNAASLTEPTIVRVRDTVMRELQRIASWPDGSPELAEFNERVRGRAIEQRRALDKLVNSPPKFGFRTGSDAWLLQFDRLNKEPGFRKSVTLRPDREAVDRMLDEKRNIWRDLLARLKITAVTPYAAAARPSPSLLHQDEAERQQRVDSEIRKLESRYGVDNPQQALRRFAADYDAETKELDRLSQSTVSHFLADPPLTLDPQLQYSAGEISGIPSVASRFDTMTGATASIALRLDSIPEPDLVLVALLPRLLTETGVVENGKTISYEEMLDRLRREILSLDARFSTDLRTNRVELVVTAAGDNLAESQRAVEWMRLVLSHPDWSARNLPRIRDLVQQSVSALRARMQGSEESWVQDPANAYYKQTNPAFLASASFLTRAWSADRLRWMLKDAGSPGDRATFESFLLSLADAPAHATRAGLKTLLEALQGRGSVADSTYVRAWQGLPAAAKQNASDAALDLEQLLTDLPDRSLAADWRFICRQIHDDVETGPEKTLERLNALRASLLRKGNARMWLAGSTATEDKLQPSLTALASDLTDGAAPAVAYAPENRVADRLRQHEPMATAPHYVGLFDANMTGGVMINTVPFRSYFDTSRDAVLDTLAAGLFGGAGAHGVFTKTIGAGLAYSNGVGYNLAQGLLHYYAERMPEVPQTLNFAIDVVKQGPRDPKLFDYMVASVFRPGHGADDYENRAEDIANELRDGVTPDVVRAFRERVQEIRKDPGASQQALARVDAVYGTVFPGYGPKARDVPGAVYFIIGADRQFAALNAEVQRREDEHVFRLYPRDYWLVGARSAENVP